MSLYVKIMLIIFGLAYLISPVDIIPDILLPFIGWLDDGVVIATIFYIIRYGKLPDFIFKNQRFIKNPKNNFHASHRSSQAGQNATSGENNGKSQDRKKASKKEEPPSNKTPYDILGVDRTASRKQIQAAYKEAIKKYHPDKLSHLGEEFSTLANEKFLEIQKAYDTLMSQNG